MERRIALFAVACVVALCVARQGLAGQAGPSAPPEPYIEVTLVRLQPAVIHERLKPRTTTVTVKVTAHGRLPRGSTAQVELGTYRSVPQGGVNVEYLPTDLVKPLKGKSTTYKFKVRTVPRGGAGTVTMAATLGAVTPGINRIDPPPTDQFLAQLKVVRP